MKKKRPLSSELERCCNYSIIRLSKIHKIIVDKKIPRHFGVFLKTKLILYYAQANTVVACAAASPFEAPVLSTQ